MTIAPIDRQHAAATIVLLRDLRVSLFGVHSSRLHDALVHDSVTGAIDGRIAVDRDGVEGVVLAAPASYWRNALVRHWGLAVDCIRARVANASGSSSASTPSPSPVVSDFEQVAPNRTWSAPGGAWRIIFVGTASSARGRGIASALYRSVMADRSLVARIAPDNGASLRLHRSLGWRLYRDGDVVLAVYDRPVTRSAPPPRAA